MIIDIHCGLRSNNRYFNIFLLRFGFNFNAASKQGFFPTKDMQDPFPLRNDANFLIDALSAELNEESYFVFFRFYLINSV